MNIEIETTNVANILITSDELWKCLNPKKNICI